MATTHVVTGDSLMPNASINFLASSDTSAATVSLALSLLVLTGPIDWPFTPNYCPETGTCRIVCVTSARHLRFFDVKFLLISIRTHSIFQAYAIENLDLSAHSMRGRCTRHRHDEQPVWTAECITAEYRKGIKIYCTLLYFGGTNSRLWHDWSVRLRTL